MKQWTTTQDFINNGKIPSSAVAGFIVQTEGYTTKGDGGGAQWKFTGVTGQTPSQSPLQLGLALINDSAGNQFELLPSDAGYYLSTAVGFSESQDPENNTYLLQAAVNTLINNNGGRLHTPKGVYPMAAIYDLDRAYLPAGFVPNDEMRRANKGLIIYQSQNIELSGDKGTIFDRSGDTSISPTYSEHSSTIYISQSSKIKITGISGLGYQVDLDLYNDIKSNTSGSHILINNGCDDVILEDIRSQDGTNGISIGVNRTSNAQEIDPLLPDCTNIKLSNVSTVNGEHGLLLAAVNGVQISNLDISTIERNSIKAALQRGIFIHSARNVKGSNIRIRGAYKTPINIADYRDVYDIKLNNVTIDEPVTGAEYFSYTGSNYNLTFESIGVRLSGQNGNSISDVKLSGLRVNDYASGSRVQSSNIFNIVYSDIEILSHYVGIDNVDYREGATTPIEPDGLSVSGVVSVVDDQTNWPNAAPNSGVNFNVVSAGKGKNLNLNNLRVFSQNRNGRIANWDGAVIGGEFTFQSGFGGARSYDLNASLGDLKIYGTVFGTQGRPNKGQDTPAGADTETILFDIGGIRRSILTSTTPELIRELNAELTNDTTLTFKIKGEDGTVRQATLNLS